MNESELKHFRELLQKKEIRQSLALMRVCCGPMRFKVLTLLGSRKEGFTVTELARVLRSSLSRVSHQLRILRRHRLVSAKGINRETIYRLRNREIAECLRQHKKINF